MARQFKKVIRWELDTCDCIVTFEDTIEEADDGNMTVIERQPKKVIRACQHHSQHAGDPAAHWEAVCMGENKHKNDTFKAIIENLPEEDVLLVDDGQGNVGRQFKYHPQFRFCPKRELHITVPGVARSKIDACLKKPAAKKICGQRKIHVEG